VRALTRVVLVLAALGLVRLAAETRGSGILANTVIVSVLAVLMVRSRRTDPDLQRTRTWMLAALLTGVAAGIAATVDQALRPDAGYPRAGDVVELLYIPCTLMALLVVPLKGIRRGFRVRAISDGLVAASSLLFLLEPWLDGVARAHTGPAAVVVAFGIPLGGVFIVATALTALARCSDEARPMLVWLVLGISMMAAADLVYAISPGTVPGLRRALLQVGLTTLVGATVARRGSSRPSLEEMPRALAVLPFLPFVGAVVLSTTYVLAGEGLTQDQLVLAIAIGLALVLRQYVGSRDKTRLVDELEQREAVLQQELRVDRLTGVANRLGLEEALHVALQQGRSFGLVIVDLDDFKLINDNHGHAVGDEVLRHVAQRLCGGVRAGDVVARLGGDEFAVLLNGPADVLAAVSDRLVDSLVAPVVVHERRFRLHASIGLVGSEDGDTVARLLADADGAMYEAKTDRSASSLVHLDREGRQSVAWRSLVREQVADPRLEQFEVHYQPIVELSTGRLRGIEALLRWQHPQYGSIPPDLFIPLAEQCGSIGKLGSYVLRTAASDLSALSRLAPRTRLAVGVNVSPRQLAATDFAELATQVMLEADLFPDQLVIEITEQAFEADLAAVQQTVSRLIAQGVSVAVDDFGTGYSSLRYLQRLGLDVLKIDRSFVSGIGEDPRQERLLDGIAALAQRMDLQIVAEGIETAEQLALLRTFGCELGQGWYFSRPLPFEELVTLVRTHHRYDVSGEPGPVPSPRSATEDAKAEPTD
jgi:diguanylate cyclase (GGDEF)-like protein